MSTPHIEVGITIGRLLQLAYSTDQGTTLKILRSAGRFTLSVSNDGQASLKSSIGVVRFQGSSAIRTFGVGAGPLEVRLWNSGGNKIHYSGIIKQSGIYGKIQGSLDIVKFITACTGLVCEAARLLDGRQEAINSRIRRAIGAP